MHIEDNLDEEIEDLIATLVYKATILKKQGLLDTVDLRINLSDGREIRTGLMNTEEQVNNLISEE